jgi:hypothetical protein
MGDRYSTFNRNILPMRGHLANLVVVANGACTHCAGRKDLAHFFFHCQRIAGFVGEPFYVRMLSAITGFPSDWDLLILALVESSASVERLVFAHLEVLVV